MKMISFRVAVIFVACLGWSIGDDSRYCSLCKDHTMCKYKGVGSACKDEGASGVSESEKKEIVDLHNKLRAMVASGKEKRGHSGGQPKAADLRKIVWDNDLAEVAQRWANQCEFGHDTCRKDPRWHVGQNVFWKSSTPKKPVNWTEGIMSWYDEVVKFNPKEIDTYSFDVSTGHYTQVVWHETYAIGCGAKEYGNQHLCVCNYGPAGNLIGSKVYSKGEPCSSCPEGTTCEDSLCVETAVSSRAEKLPLFRYNAQWRNNEISEESGSSSLEGHQQAENKDTQDLDFEVDEDVKNEITEIHEHLDLLLYTVLKKNMKEKGNECEQNPKNSSGKK